MNTTRIEWCDKTWNIVTGCTPVSEGCAHCYAARRAKMLARNPKLPADVRERYVGFRPTFHRNRLLDPTRVRKPSRIFVGSMGDLFHEEIDFLVPFQVLLRAAIGAGSRHTYLLLTKRPERMRDFFRWVKDRPQQGLATVEWPLPNVWLGVTAENQARFDERVPFLDAIPAAKKFVSIEPMLGLIQAGTLLLAVDWVICGGETGPGARPVHPAPVRSLRDQCVSRRVPFFFKGWGEYCAPSQMPADTFQAWDCEHGTEAWDRDAPRWRVGKKYSGRLLDGRTWEEVPT